MRIRIILIVLSLPLFLSNCMSYDFSRQTTQQGNLLPESRLHKLHLGMSQEQVAILLGTSLTTPLFNNDRLDYAYTFEKHGHTQKAQHVVLYFKQNKLTRIVQ